MISRQYLFVVALYFVTLGWTAPAIPIMANSTGISWHPASHTQSTCDPSTFSESPNTDPADWKHCASLYSSWILENGTFKLGDLDATGFTPILHTTDCTLGVRPADPCLGPFTIGDSDIKTLLETSLKEFSEGTDLRVTGTIKCATAIGNKGDIIWRISKS